MSSVFINNNEFRHIGTGKTLCLLCATLGWIEKRANASDSEEIPPNEMLPVPKVIYASRTHSQLLQGELMMNACYS